MPVTFELAADPSAVAIQFDVNGAAGTLSWTSPGYQGSSAHLVEIGPIGGASSGKTRYVIYSTSGTPISASGKVAVTYASSAPLANGIITINGVVASNASGQSVPASPTALPISSVTQTPHWSVQSGQTAQLSASVVDLDGSVASTSFDVGGQAAGSASGNAPVVLWNAVGSGLKQVTALVTDNSGRSASIVAGNIHVYALSDISSFAAFQNIHFGPGASGANAGVGADPYKTGVRNGIAFVLGLNPANPDLSLLPKGEMRSAAGGGKEYIFRFSRPTTVPASSWSVLETGDFSSWSVVPGNRISEGAAVNDRVPVEARVPVPVSGKAFLRLGATAAAP